MNSPNTSGREALALRLAALAHPARLEILGHLGQHPACCCKDVVGRLDLAQSTVSQHLKVLVEAGLVRFSAERPRSRYTVETGAMEELATELRGLVDACCTPVSQGECQSLHHGE